MKCLKGKEPGTVNSVDDIVFRMGEVIEVVKLVVGVRAVGLNKI